MSMSESNNRLSTQNYESGHCECPKFYCKWSFFFGKSMGFVSLKLFPLNCMPNDELLFRRGTKINGLYAVLDESVVLVTSFKQ